MKSELELLKEANGLMRSMHSIISRKGKKVNWEAIEKQVNKALDEQHKLLVAKNCFIADVGGAEGDPLCCEKPLLYYCLKTGGMRCRKCRKLF